MPSKPIEKPWVVCETIFTGQRVAIDAFDRTIFLDHHAIGRPGVWVMGIAQRDLLVNERLSSRSDLSPLPQYIGPDPVSR